MLLSVTASSIWETGASMITSIFGIITSNVLFETIAIAGIVIPAVLGFISFFKN